MSREAQNLFFGARADQADHLLFRRRQARAVLANFDSEVNHLAANHSTLAEAREQALAVQRKRIDILRDHLEQDEHKRQELETRIAAYDLQLNDTRHMIKVHLKGLFGGQGAETLRIEREHLAKKREMLYFQQEKHRDAYKLAEQEYEQLMDPLNDLQFAQESLNDNRVDTEVALAHHDTDLRNLTADVLMTDPLEILAYKLSRLKDEVSAPPSLSALLALRETLLTETTLQQPYHATTTPKRENLSQAVQEGFTQGTAFGRGSIQVSGSGTKRVRRTRTTTDANGNRRSESYYDHVPVSFSGTVSATFDVTTTQWDPAPLGKATAAVLMQQWQDSDKESATRPFPNTHRELHDLTHCLKLEL